MSRKKDKMVEVSKLKFSIKKNKFSTKDWPGHAWFVVVTPSDCHYRYLQWLPDGTLRLGYTAGNQTKADKFFSSPGWYRTRSQARMIVQVVKYCNTIRCEV